MIVTDDKTALMTQADFDDLPEYSCSLPSMTTIGKRWRRGEPYCAPRTHWYLGEYVEIDDPHKVGIAWREILIC